MNIQLDFGGFDPSFIGVSVRFGNARSFDFYKTHTKSPSPLPVSEMSHDERFEALSIASVLSHEIRHFHDFLLTPYSARVFALRIRMLIYLLQILPEIVKDGPNCVPVPFATWCSLDEAEREAQLAWLPLRVDGERWRPVQLPRILKGVPADNGPMAQALAKVLNLREEIRELAYNPAGQGKDALIQPWQIFELPAVFVQMSEIWHTYGAEETSFYLKYLDDAGPNPYSTMLRLTRKLWDDKGRLMNLNVASAMATWCLLGSYKKDNWKACPTERYARLWLHLSKVGVPEWSGDAIALFNQWSMALGLSTVHDGIKEARDNFYATHTAIKAKAASLAQTMVGTSGTELLLRVTQAVGMASDHMMQSFESEPNAYVEPYRYLKSVDRYVNPLYRKVYAGGLLSLYENEASLKQRGATVQWGFEVNGRLLVQSLVEPYPLSEHRFLDAEDTLLLASLNGLVDFLVSDTDRVNIDVQQTGELFFGGTHLRAFEVFV